MLLHTARDGEDAAEKRLLDALYHDLRRVAAAMLRQERADHTLQPTALVHEAYIRFFDVEALRDGAPAPGSRAKSRGPDPGPHVRVVAAVPVDADRLEAD